MIYTSEFELDPPSNAGSEAAVGDRLEDRSSAVGLVVEGTRETMQSVTIVV